jgi:hypothetical protein
MLVAICALLSLHGQASLPWQSFTSQNRRMAVELPGRYFVETSAEPRGQKASYSRLNAGFVVIFSDLPLNAKSLPEVVDLWKSLVVQRKLALIEEKEVEWSGYPGYEVTATVDAVSKLTFRFRFVVAKDQLVQQFASWTDSSYDEVSVNRFFKSLVIK